MVTRTDRARIERVIADGVEELLADLCRADRMPIPRSALSSVKAGVRAAMRGCGTDEAIRVLSTLPDVEIKSRLRAKLHEDMKRALAPMRPS